MKHIKTYDSITEGTYNSKDHIGSTSDGQGANAEIYKKGKGYYVVVSGEVDYDFTAKNDKELLQKIDDAEFDSTDIVESVNEYGGSEWSKITSLQNYLTIDLDKFEKGLKDSKHKAIYKKARKQFMGTVSAVAFEHSKLHEGKLDADVKVYGRDFTHVNESYNQSDVDYAMKMAFDNIPGNWHKALKRVKYSKRSKSVKLNMSSYMGPGKVLQKIVDEFNKSMGTKYKIDKDSFVKGSITSIELRER